MSQQRNGFPNVRRRLAVAGIGALGFSGLLFGGFASPASATGGGSVSVENWFDGHDFDFHGGADFGGFFDHDSDDCIADDDNDGHGLFDLSDLFDHLFGDSNLFGNFDWLNFDWLNFDWFGHSGDDDDSVTCPPAGTDENPGTGNTDPPAGDDTPPVVVDPGADNTDPPAGDDTPPVVVDPGADNTDPPAGDDTPPVVVDPGTDNQNPDVTPSAEDPGTDDETPAVEDQGTDTNDDGPRCAHSRNNGCGHDKVDPEVIVDPIQDVVIPPAAPVADPVTIVAGTGDQAAAPAEDLVLAVEAERAAPEPAPTGALPRTGSNSIAPEVFLGFALLTAGTALRRITQRRRPALEG